VFAQDAVGFRDLFVRRHGRFPAPVAVPGSGQTSSDPVNRRFAGSFGGLDQSIINGIWQFERAAHQSVLLLEFNKPAISLSTQRPPAVELNRTGREVWEYKTDTRVTRAFRR